MKTSGKKYLILGNPNNPTGRAISATELERLAEVCRETHTWLMLDECFQWFLDTRRECSFVGNLLNGVGDHVILLNALTKICSMAGLRLGNGIIPNAGLRERLEKFRQPWSVSAPAQAGGVAAFVVLADHSEGNLLEWTVKIFADGTSAAGGKNWKNWDLSFIRPRQIICCSVRRMRIRAITNRDV